ncbi:DeoR family transcriptional regulator protein (plasmid) [Rhizobium sp. CIAT894]|uniref:DeoR/GlpR family DNA-binding transcription regulator n=1 Tax=Rhizobium sp. CIAT894 TaxID=2020312 RepID=UPI000A1F0FD9|nr:DeoR/GlpR family DNA-binding transcription regulator [Rhizobium sp. CIAT894]ARM92242.1 DeoR family transcriptional regulator protein [Rhizobium sp. CIAT894]
MKKRPETVPASSPEERQAILLERINQQGRVLATAIARELCVSEDSIRRDLKELVDAGLVQRFHGGAMRLSAPVLDFRRREVLDGPDKSAIGRAAAASIPDDVTIFVDSSTTVLHFLRNLPPSLQVRILTTSVDIAAAALDHPIADVTILGGGKLNRLTRSATGALAVEAVRSVRADICVLGTCGVDEKLTLRADDIEDAFLKAAMIKAAGRTLLLASHEKLGLNATYEVAPISTISTLYTTATNEPMISRIREAGVEVVEVGSKSDNFKGGK